LIQLPELADSRDDRDEPVSLLCGQVGRLEHGLKQRGKGVNAAQTQDSDHFAFRFGHRFEELI
jgi:hypothetical protein